MGKVILGMNSSPKTYFILFFFVFYSLATLSYAGEFIPETGPRLSKVVMKKDGYEYRRLLAKFSYLDNKNQGWQAKKGLLTNGASIPYLARYVVGKPFDKEFINASVLHDHYCTKGHTVRPWTDTHWMFYEALLDSGVNEGKALGMYLAVLVFGPKWTIVKGKNCDGIENCVMTASGSVTAKAYTPDIILDKEKTEKTLQNILDKATRGKLTEEQLRELAIQERNKLGFGTPEAIVLQQKK